MHQIKVPVALLVALFLGLASQAAVAQYLSRGYAAEVKMGHTAQFEEALAKHTQWRKQQGDPWTWNVYQVVNGENLGTYYIHSGQHTWKDFDDYQEFLAKGSVEFGKTVSPHLESISSSMGMMDTTNVRWPEDGGNFKLFSLITFQLKPGKEPVFRQAVNKFHKAFMKEERPGYYLFDWTVNGGPGNTVTIVLPYENWAAMQGPDEDMGAYLVRVLGAEEAQKMFEQFESTYSSSESEIVQFRPELSVTHDM